ncbi:MAG: ABC transporter permease, partial [Geminicoccales bacterium]
MNSNSLRAVVASEVTKLRTVWSTRIALLLTVFISAGLGFLIALSLSANFSEMSQEDQNRFDPFFYSFYSLTLGQLALVVFGVIAVSGEYSSGTIRAALLATPQRGRLYLGKVVAATLLILGVSLAAVLGAFYAAQAGLGELGTSLDADGMPRAAVGAFLYLTLICLFAMGVAAMLRSAVASLAVLMPLFFLGSQGLGNVPKLKTVTQYLPDQTGMVIMGLTGPEGDPAFG